MTTSVESYKKFIKKKVRLVALRYLNERKETHSKIKSIEYKDLETRDYITSPLFTNTDVKLLFSLRSRMVDCKQNFKSKYKEFNLLCPFCEQDNESQSHMVTLTQSNIRSHPVTQSHSHTVTQSYSHTVTQSHIHTITQSHSHIVLRHSHK